MSKAGPEIIAALEDAAAGKFARVTIRGQAWIPETPLHRAAPDMLEALKELYLLRGYNCDLEDEASLRARAAIVKAEGR